jgi:hypothetical protein
MVRRPKAPGGTGLGAAEFGIETNADFLQERRRQQTPSTHDDNIIGVLL